MAPVAALMLLGARPAWAGHWEEVPLPQQGDPTYQTEVARRYKGTVTYDKSEGLAPNEKQYPVNPADKVQDIATRPTSLWGSDSTSGGHLHLHYDVKRRSIFRWVRNRIDYYTDDPNDKPDDFLYLKISSGASAQSYRAKPSSGSAGTSVASASADGTTATATEFPGSGGYTSGEELVNLASTDSVQRLLKYPAAKDEVEGPWVSTDAEIYVSGGRYSSGSSSSGSYGDSSSGGYGDSSSGGYGDSSSGGYGDSSSGGYSGSPLPASASAGYSYNAQIVNFRLSVSMPKGAPLVIKSELQEWNGYLKQDYRLNAPGDPLVPFWSGNVLCSAYASDSGGNKVFDPQLYKWSIDGGAGSGQPYVPEPDAQQGADVWGWKYLPEDDGTYPTKEFHLDFGAGAPGTAASTIRVIITDDKPASTALTAKAVVHWNLPRWFVTKPPAGGGTVTTVTGDADPDKPSGPVNVEDDPDNPAYAAMQNIKAYQQAQQDLIKTGATLVAGAMQIYGEVAAILFYDLGGAALASAVTRVADLSRAALEARRVANEAAQIAIETKRVAQDGRAAGKSAEEIAQLERTAAEADLQYAFESKSAAEMEALVAKSNNKVKTLSDNLTENKYSHWFEGTEHPYPNMVALAQQCGGQEAAVRKVLKALGDLPNGPIGGTYLPGMSLTLNGIGITVRGEVFDGVIKIGTIF